MHVKYETSRFGCRVAGFVIVALLCSPAAALINQNYTPVDIVHQSDTILHVQVGPWDQKTDRLAAKLIGKCLKGQLPDGFALTVDSPDEAVSNAIAKILKTSDPRAMVFLGDFSEAKDEETDDAEKIVGAIYLNTEWFALDKISGGAFRIRKDIYDLKTVWAGGNDMLAKVVQYAQTDSRADVPTNTSTSWSSDARLAVAGGPVSALLPADNGAALMLSSSGDRLLRRNGGAKLFTKSSSAAWGDFNADGLPDLACWGDGGLTLSFAAKDGVFKAAPATVEIKECIGLTALPAGKGGRVGLLVSTTGRPVLLTLDGKGGVLQERMQAGETSKLGLAGPCLAADFDGDGLVDVVQPFVRGLVLYRGKALGVYGPPAAAGSIVGGDESGSITTAICGDYDADGRLDILLAGADGCTVLANRDGKVFREVIRETGELTYISKPKVIGASNCDINNDGRQDVVLFYSNMGMQVFFNRGFHCFGFANLLDPKNSKLPTARAFGEGQSAGAVMDINGDGAQDLLAATTTGEVRGLLRDSRRGGNLSLTVSLSTDLVGPVTVVGYDGKRCLGARVASAGQPAMFGKSSKGPITVKWTHPGSKPQSKRIIVLKTSRFVLPLPPQ